ncbi:PREDICTED: progesterone-induced-blocking factor 1-like [Acropora digitifera]|uniref:progesterone-induced-blocking factor 1-like n=1 Tax=Acropora digitifera TaxID=70779 RepID=UPI00077B1924|nr:PREDICTED: progesterone-induced-blocking factor 1-like [Acropora digitifera]
MSGRENGSLRSTHTNESNQNSTLQTENDATSTENTTVESSTLLTSSALSSSQVDSEGDSRITKHEIERKQLLHDLELLRIELRQKNLVIDNMKVEHLGKVDELEELLDDNRHDKQILQARLESQLRLQQEEAKSALERMRQELAILLEKQKTLEVKNKKLEEKAFDYQVGMDLEVLSDENYLELKSNDPSDLGLREFIMIKIYEARHALSLECESLRHQVEALTHDLHAREEKVALYRKQAEDERMGRTEMEQRVQKLSLQVERLQSQVNQGDYKITNFDQVRSERDTLDRDIMEMRKNNTVLNAALKTKTESLLDLQKELHTSKQTVALLKQDKDYMSRQSQEIRGRCTLAEERLEQTVKQLEETKQAREELYEKYISVREQYKSEYELRLKTEIDNIKDKTSVELDKIRVDTKEMFERENRNLREARDNAVEEKERACVNEKEMSLKYNQLQSGVLNKEYYALQNSSEKRLVELESKCKEQSDKLDVYEKLEKELDDVIMQAAEIENESDAERVLFSYGYGANVPSTAKRRMQQSVQLARRVLHLERANTSLRNEMEREKKKKDLLGKELSKATSLLNEAQQPYNYLIESIRSRDMQNQSLNEQIALMEEDIRKLKAEKEDLISTRNQLSSDLERLLNQREEMAVMKQAILGLHSSKNSHSPLTRKIAGNHGQKSRHRTSAVESASIQGANQPKPTIFTKSDPPTWYRKLKSHNLTGHTTQESM